MILFNENYINSYKIILVFFQIFSIESLYYQYSSKFFMQKDSKPRYLTVLRNSNQIDDSISNFSNEKLESNNAGLYGFLGKVPKYSKPFSQAYLQKIQSDYQNWIDSCNTEEYHEMMKEAELKDNKLSSSNQKVDYSSQQATKKFDPCKARRILSKSFKIKETNNKELLADINNPTIETQSSQNLDSGPKIHHHKQFHVGCVERTNDGTIKTFDKSAINRKEAQEKKLTKKILRYDELDLENKKKKTRMLHAEMKNFLNNKRNEKIQLGLTCHQEWAILKASAPSKQIQEEIQRPITASSKEAMDELEEFEQKQKLIRKEKKAAKNNKSIPQKTDSTSTKNNNLNEIDSNSPDQSFKYTQLPPGSAIIG